MGVGHREWVSVINQVCEATPQGATGGPSKISVSYCHVFHGRMAWTRVEFQNVIRSAIQTQSYVWPSYGPLVPAPATGQTTLRCLPAAPGRLRSCVPYVRIVYE